MSGWEIVLRGGRVIDPESGFDAVADVAIGEGRVAQVGTDLPAAPTDVDVAGLVVTAGFVDLHSHVNDLAGQRLQALDGVTTALELEAGASPVAAAYRSAAAEGRPVNYGFATSWAQARMGEVAGMAPGGTLADFLSRLGDPRWQRPAQPAQLSALLSRLATDLADGALGIGVLLGYAPAVDPGEYLRVAALAAEAGVPTFTHARDLIEMVPQAIIDGAEEIVRAAGQTGAHMHYCHVNSTSQRHVDRVLGLVGRAQAAGAHISTEAYPYGLGMTAIGAAFLAPERLAERGLVPASLSTRRPESGWRAQTRLRELRRADPGGLAIIELLNEDDAADRRLLMRSLDLPWRRGGQRRNAADLDRTGPHNRPAGLAARRGRHHAPADSGDLQPRHAAAYPRRRAAEPGPGAEQVQPAAGQVARGSGACHAAQGPGPGGRRRRRGGLRPCHAPDQATYADSTRPSAGIRHVLVNGTFVVRDGSILTAARPGRPVRAEPR